MKNPHRSLIVTFSRSHRLILLLSTFVLLAVLFVFARDSKRLALISTQKPPSSSSFSSSVSSLDKQELRTEVHQNFLSDSTYTLPIQSPIYRLTMDGSVTFLSEKSLVRVVLIDSQGVERLVYESYPLLSDSTAFSMTGACIETCALNAVTPVSLKVQIIDAVLGLKAFNSSDALAKLSDAITSKGIAAYSSDLKQAQQASDIAKLNASIQQKGLKWVAGVTSVSNMSYQEKLRLFTTQDGTPARDLPNLQGAEYYTGGIFSVSSVQSKTDGPVVQSLTLPLTWDWRNVHGENWLTPVRNQGPEGSCLQHAAMAAVESAINLYFNQHADIDLSEQAFVSCMWTTYRNWPSDGLPPPPIPECDNISSPTKLLCDTKIAGAVDEACYPYTNVYDCYGMLGGSACTTYPPNGCALCGGMCADYASREWRVTDFKQLSPTPTLPYQELFTEENLKSAIMQYGPVAVFYTPWFHGMAIVGWIQDDFGTSWILKNSWGTSWGEGGYGRFYVPLSDFSDAGLAVSPIIQPPNSTLQIRCVDNDADGYCNWGISEEKPSTCAATCRPQKDCNDANPVLGPYDANYQCSEICIPDWQCGPWGSCVSGQQTRTCTDVRNCGTEEGRPTTTQSCTGCIKCSDINGDGIISPTDVMFVINRLGKCPGVPGYDARADIDGGGCILPTDAMCVINRVGQVPNCVP